MSKEKIPTQAMRTTENQSKDVPWENADNANFYNKIPVEFFMQVAAQGGLDDGCDIRAINQYIKSARSILEVGAGYGRVIEGILKQGYCGHLTAVERTPLLCKHLQKQFGEKLTVICNDIQKTVLTNTYDLILWMWVGISEFSKQEQYSVINLLAASLNPRSFLIIDIIPLECATQNSVDYDMHNRIITTPYGKNYCYLPDSYEIAEYANNCGLKQYEKISYTTKTNKTNYLYVLQKNN